MIQDISQVLKDNSIITLSHVLQDFQFYSRVLQNIRSGNSSGMVTVPTYTIVLCDEYLYCSNVKFSLNFEGNVTLGNIVVDPQQIISTFQDNDTRQAIIDLLGTSLNLNLVSRFIQTIYSVRIFFIGVNTDIMFLKSFVNVCTMFI